MTSSEEIPKLTEPQADTLECLGEVTAQLDGPVALNVFRATIIQEVRTWEPKVLAFFGFRPSRSSVLNYVKQLAAKGLVVRRSQGVGSRKGTLLDLTPLGQSTLQRRLDVRKGQVANLERIVHGQESRKRGGQ